MNFIMSILEKLIHLIYYRHRSNTIKTGIKGYAEADQMLLYSSFSILSDFVEGEVAWLRLILNDKERKKVPWYMPLKSYCKKHAERLGRDGINTQEIAELYEWWKDIRPNRIDPFDDPRFEELESVDILDRMRDEEYMKLCKEAGKISDQHYEEDTEMLVRLMKIRGRLWT